MLKLVLYGYTGSGKSTTSMLFHKAFERMGYTVTILKLAQPLYEIQQYFYRIAGHPMSFYNQDQALLEIIATQLRRISPTSIVDDFVCRLQNTSAGVILNDDLRDTKVDYPRLKDLGFVFIRVSCDEALRIKRLQQRQDVSIIIHSASTADLETIQPNFVVDNSSGLADLEDAVHRIIEKLEVVL